jgi:serine/threonine-protein kinase
MSEEIKLGKYQIIKELGRGGFGIVYEALDSVLNRRVAIKVLHPTLTVDTQFLYRFQQEAGLAARMEHPNIVTIHDFDQQDGRYFIVMSLMRQGSLKDRLQKLGALSTDQAQIMFKQVASGLAYAHEQGIIHRDLKPGNILIDEHGIARVADFGFAKALDGNESMTFSTLGNPMGTAAYMAPEIWEGKPASVRSDLYSLGCIGHEMLTGKALFEGESTAQIVTQHVVYGPQLAEDLPDGWRKLLSRCLMKDPNERYPSANALLEDLQWGVFSAPQELQSEIVLRSVEVDSEDVEGIEYLPSSMADTGLVFDEHEISSDGIEDGTIETDNEHEKKEFGNYGQQPASERKGMQKWLLPGLLGLLALVLMVVLLAIKNNTAKWAFYTQQTQSVTATNTSTNTPTRTNTPTQTNTPTRTKTSTPTQTNTPTITPTSTPVTKVRSKDGMEMVYVPEGEFTMGSTDSDAWYDESPVREVRLDAYWIDKYEVSNGQYQECVNAGKCIKPRSTESWKRASYYGNAEYNNYPVVYVDWRQAKAYCEWAGGSLPTEAQWEKAARGTDARKYPWEYGSPSCDKANYSPDWSNNVICVGDTERVGTYPAGASPYGAMDMAGNVWEWVLDWYGPYNEAETNNPKGPGTGDLRVLRGGSWIDEFRGILSANRIYHFSTNAYYDFGFRCVSSP